MINGREIELFEPPKILGDIFEAIMGGVFMDGGIEAVIQVYEHLLAPFILFTSKFSKKLKKEPKEDFLIYANLLKIKPVMKSQEPRVMKLRSFLNPKDSSDQIVSPIEKNLNANGNINEDVDMEVDGDEDELEARLTPVHVIFNNNEVMVTGY